MRPEDGSFRTSGIFTPMGAIIAAPIRGPASSPQRPDGRKFPGYIIERPRRRAIRPIGREFQRKRAPEARLPPVRWLQPSRLAMAREMRFPGNFSRLQIRLPPVPLDRPVGHFPWVSREISRATATAAKKVGARGKKWSFSAIPCMGHSMP